MTDEGADRFRLMFERSADAILLLDTVSNHFVEYNEAALRMLACSRAELATLHPSALSPERQPDGRASFDKANAMIARAVAEGSHPFEWVHRSPHRADFWVEVLLTPIQPGPTPLLLVVWRDITERRQAELALREAQRRETVGVLAAGIAHDFNNLLMAISGHLELARAGMPPGQAALAHLNRMGSAVQRAGELARQMLAYGGRAQSRVELVDLSAVVAELAELMAVVVPKTVALLRKLEAGLPRVRADSALLQQVVLNLVTNAAEAIGAREGRIELSTAARELDAEGIGREFAGQAIAPGRFVFLTVADSGDGMSEEVRARIFDPFFTTKRTGRGLGLSATLGILRTHGGAYRIESSPGAGTRFSVAFPAAAGAGPPAPTRTAVVGGELGGVVLLVDDEEMVRRATRAMLEFLGAEVVEAADGAEAVARFREQAGRIDWVLMDLTMPRMDGHAAFLAMRELDPAVRVVLVSGWAGEELAARFRDAPPAAFLDKPYQVRDLVAVARRVGGAR